MVLSCVFCAYRTTSLYMYVHTYVHGIGIRIFMYVSAYILSGHMSHSQASMEKQQLASISNRQVCHANIIVLQGHSVHFTRCVEMNTYTTC